MKYVVVKTVRGAVTEAYGPIMSRKLAEDIAHHLWERNHKRGSFLAYIAVVFDEIPPDTIEGETA
jgi:phenylpyruvate tautomerase PptA (4-oxalocrotonate tautomerase family)